MIDFTRRPAACRASLLFPCRCRFSAAARLGQIVFKLLTCNIFSMSGGSSLGAEKRFLPALREKCIVRCIGSSPSALEMPSGVKVALLRVLVRDHLRRRRPADAKARVRADRHHRLRPKLGHLFESGAKTATQDEDRDFRDIQCRPPLHRQNARVLSQRPRRRKRGDNRLRAPRGGYYPTRLACHRPVPNWLRLTMPWFWSLAAPSTAVPLIFPSRISPSKK